MPSSAPIALHLVAQAEHPGCPSPPGLGPYHLRAVDAGNDADAHAGCFAPKDWLESAAAGDTERLRNWLALALVSLDQEEAEVEAVCQDAWAAGQTVVVVFTLDNAVVRHAWEPENEPLVERAERARAERKALELGVGLETDLPQASRTVRPLPRM